ncbi:MAG: ABC transporter ATP-binding protein [Clostridia bacterium]
MSLLEISHFSKTYKGDKRAVDDLSLTIEPGDIYGFIGHNGAGKSTTIRAVVGVLDFEAGEIAICGHSVKREPLACKQLTAYLPDNPDLYDHLRGIDFIHFVADLFGVAAEVRKERIAYYSALFEMTEPLGDVIQSYSHGMKQKLALIAAFVHAPKLMVMDEPFVGLDPSASSKLKSEMRKLCAAGGAIFFSTHVLEVAEKLCNKVAIIKNGKLIAAGDMEKVQGQVSLEERFMEVAQDEA